MKKWTLKYFGFPILDIYFCPFLKIPEKSWKKIIVVTIIEIYGLVTQKIISKL